MMKRPTANKTTSSDATRKRQRRRHPKDARRRAQRFRPKVAERCQFFTSFTHRMLAGFFEALFGRWGACKPHRGRTFQRPIGSVSFALTYESKCAEKPLQERQNPSTNVPRDVLRDEVTRSERRTPHLHCEAKALTAGRRPHQREVRAV